MCACALLVALARELSTVSKGSHNKKVRGIEVVAGLHISKRLPRVSTTVNNHKTSLCWG